MIDWAILLVGFFLLAAGVRRDGKAEDRVAFIISFFALLVILHALGFLLKPVMYTHPTLPYFTAFLFGFACIRSGMQGRGFGALCALIAEISVLVYAIMGSFA